MLTVSGSKQLSVNNVTSHIQGNNFADRLLKKKISLWHQIRK